MRQIALKGTDVFYEGPIADEIADVVQDPITAPGATLPAFAGYMTADDIADYEVIERDPTHIEYRGLDVYGMAPSSSGGTTVGESLNILENYDLSAADTAQSLHLYFEATAHAFADRNAYVGDPAFVDVPTETLLSQDFADARACVIDPDVASVKPVAPAPLDAAGCAAAALEEQGDTEGISTTHLSVVDQWGNAVAYTLTIESTGGSGMTVPDRGFLLNNELTDFSFLPNPADPNIVEPGKRPRSSMSPTIVLDEGDLRYVVGSPGGSMIITTVTQVLMNRIDLGMTLPEAVAAPRASQRNTAAVAAEPAFRAAYEALLTPYGHTFTTTAEIGAVAAIEVGDDGLLTAVAEPVRRGGGTGLVVDPADCRASRWATGSAPTGRITASTASHLQTRLPAPLQRPQSRRQVALEQLEEPPLVVARGVEDEVVEAPVHVLADLRHDLVGVGADDPALGDLLDRQGVGRSLHLDRVGDVVLLLLRERQRRPEPGVLERGLLGLLVRELDLDHAVDRVVRAAARLQRPPSPRG